MLKRAESSDRKSRSSLMTVIRLGGFEIKSAKRDLFL
jgi:hypothetical protein